MTGVEDTDIRLNDNWELTQAANGDAPLCSGMECLLQTIALDAVVQPGDWFDDLTFGWGLYDCIKSENDELTQLDILQRAQAGLEKYEAINQDSIETTVDFAGETFQLHCTFRFAGEDDDRTIDIDIGTEDVEVTRLD